MTDRLIRDFLRDDAGSPLGSACRAAGRCAPTGSRTTRRGRRCCAAIRARTAGSGAAGTVDHVDPRSRAARGLGTVHGWLNTIGACTRCNGAKRDLGLLVFLYRRRWSGATARPGEPARATRRIVPVASRGHRPPAGGAGGPPRGARRWRDAIVTGSVRG